MYLQRNCSGNYADNFNMVGSRPFVLPLFHQPGHCNDGKTVACLWPGAQKWWPM